MRNKGFSEEVAKQVTGAIKPDSQKVYENKWKLYNEWCLLNNIDPLHISEPNFADFMLYLFQKKSLATPTIKGYRSALAGALRYTTDFDISSSSILSDLIRSFEKERPPGKRGFPKWELRIVLNSLTEPPYEPLVEADLKWLTFKTVFLLMLASGARRSEIHALDTKHITQSNGWKYVTLKPNPKFLSKNFNYKSGTRNFEGFTIEALKHRVGTDMPKDATLCPVRALKTYLAKTENLRAKENSQLFVALNSKKPVARNSISSWIKHTIKYAYENCTEDTQTLLKVSAHEVRAIATSTAFYGNQAVEEILRSARWAHQTTFTTYYLRDVSQDLQGIHRLGPVMVANQVLL